MSIFISTNQHQPKNLYTALAEKKKVGQFMTEHGFKTIENEPGTIVQVFENVYLLPDTLEHLPDSVAVNSLRDHLLYHTSTSQGVLIAFVNKFEGAHEIGDEFYYRSVFDILLDPSIASADKAARIIALFPRRELFVDFLCAIRDRTPLSAIVPLFPAYVQLPEFVTLKEQVFINDVNHYDPNNDMHLASLRALRDAV